jgi:hypothetical protein
MTLFVGSRRHKSDPQFFAVISPVALSGARNEKPAQLGKIQTANIPR